MNKIGIIITALVWSVVCAGSRFKPGNTLSNCNPVVTCASCKGLKSIRGFRTLDGTCNNLRKRVQGAANTQLKRILHADYVDARCLDTPRGFPHYHPLVPTANEVSRGLFHVGYKNRANRRGTSVMFMTFGQFLDHDITLTPHASCKVSNCGSINTYKYPCFPIKFESGTSCTGFARSIPVCQTDGGRRKTRNQINTISAYIDASQVYSNDFKTHQSLRKLDGTGQMKMLRNGLLPVKQGPCSNPGGCTLVGEVRGDENIALNSMQTLWVREHNRIAEVLKRINFHWNEHNIFETSRKIVGAIFQHIVYKEYVPFLARLRPYRGYRSYVDPSISNGFATAAFRYGHSLVPNSWTQLDKNFNKVAPNVPIRNTFMNTSLIRQNGIEPIMLGLLGNQSEEVDTTFSFGISRKLFIPQSRMGYMDLTALNIQRGRDHGIPTYGSWRRICGLRRLRSWGDLYKLMSVKSIRSLRKLYGNPNDIDLFAAGIAEYHVRGLEVGPTFNCIINDQYERLRDGDRYFYQRRGVFTRRQRREIIKMSLAKVLCNNLKGVVSLQKNAFKAFSAGARRVVCTSIPGMDLNAWRQSYHG